MNVLYATLLALSRSHHVEVELLRLPEVHVEGELMRRKWRGEADVEGELMRWKWESGRRGRGTNGRTCGGGWTCRHKKKHTHLLPILCTDHSVHDVDPK